MCSHKVGTDAPFYPPEHNQEKPPQAPPKEGMLPNGMPYKGKWVDRRGCLSLLKKPYPHPLSEWKGE